MPGKEAQLASLADAAAKGVEDRVSEDTDAAFTADETEFNVFNTDRKLTALESLTDLLREIPGKKSVIQFTSGITQTGEDNRSQLHATTDAANRANVSIYTVDSRGSDGRHSRRRCHRRRGHRHLACIRAARLPSDRRARGFTGDAVHAGVRHRRARFFDLGDLGDGFPQRAGGYGRLLSGGLLQLNAAHDGRWRTIHVRVSGVPGARLRFREGYYAPKDFGVFTTEDRERQLEDAMKSRYAPGRAARGRGNVLFPARQKPSFCADLRQAGVERAAVGGEERPPPSAI